VDNKELHDNFIA
jgi:tubby-related protein 1